MEGMVGFFLSTEEGSDPQLSELYVGSIYRHNVGVEKLKGTTNSFANYKS